MATITLPRTWLHRTGSHSKCKHWKLICLFFKKASSMCTQWTRCILTFKMAENYPPHCNPLICKKCCSWETGDPEEWWGVFGKEGETVEIASLIWIKPSICWGVRNQIWAGLPVTREVECIYTHNPLSPIRTVLLHHSYPLTPSIYSLTWNKYI